MIYEIAHILKDKFGFLWEAVEMGNEKLFVLMHKDSLKDIPEILKEVSNETFTIRMTDEADAPKLAKFFSEQPEDAFEFFKPHGFDEKSIRRIVRNKAFQTFVVMDGDRVIGYFFLRSFFTGKCFRGRMADYRSRGKGIGKLMAKAIERVAVYEKGSRDRYLIRSINVVGKIEKQCLVRQENEHQPMCTTLSCAA